MRLSVEPRDGLVDDPPSITLEGAEASESIELELATTDAAVHRWRFSGNYTAGRGAAGVGADDVMLSFADAGHFIRPPVTPTTVPWNDALVSGGTAAGNARAQSETWKATLSFLDTHLSS